MNFILDVLIPEKQIELINLSEILAEWGGEVFPKETREFLFESTLVFHQNPDLKYYQGILGGELENYIALTLQGEELTNLAYLVNAQREEAKKNILMRFFKQLLSLEHFYILLLKEEEEIDRKYQIGNADELLTAICQSLNWTSPEGSVIAK
ncbi:hypothetical protein AALG83_03700 [Christensenellaceae bacterium 44-20]